MIRSLFSLMYKMRHIRQFFSKTPPSNKLYFSLVPLDLFVLILDYFTMDELFALIPVFKTFDEFKSLLNSRVGKVAMDNFWKYNISSYLPAPNNIEDLITSYNLIPKGGYKEIEYLAKNGYDELLQPLLGNKIVYYDIALISASEGGQIKLVNKLLDLGATEYNDALRGAAAGGHLKIVQKMLVLGADSYDEAIADAEENNHLDIAEFIRAYERL